MGGMLHRLAKAAWRAPGIGLPFVAHTRRRRKQDRQ